MSYAEKLKDPRWQKKRLKILERDNWTCVYCGDKESTLHIHHLKYSGEPYEADDMDLLTACKYCHSLIEYYKNFKGIRFARFNCSQGKLFMTSAADAPGKIYFDIVDNDGNAEELAVFSEEAIYSLKKMFKRRKGSLPVLPDDPEQSGSK